MTAPAAPTIHASAVQVGRHAILIRGPSGAGKSQLAFDLIVAGRGGQIPVAVLIGDDRICVMRHGEVLIARPAPALEGLIEIRGLGIRRCAFAPEAPVGLVVDLSASDAQRMPAAEASSDIIEGIKIPRIAVAVAQDALRLVVASLITSPGAHESAAFGRLPEGIW